MTKKKLHRTCMLQYTHTHTRGRAHARRKKYTSLLRRKSELVFFNHQRTHKKLQSHEETHVWSHTQTHTACATHTHQSITHAARRRPRGISFFPREFVLFECNIKYVRVCCPSTTRVPLCSPVPMKNAKRREREKALVLVIFLRILFLSRAHFFHSCSAWDFLVELSVHKKTGYCGVSFLL